MQLFYYFRQVIAVFKHSEKLPACGQTEPKKFRLMQLLNFSLRPTMVHLCPLLWAVNPRDGQTFLIKYCNDIGINRCPQWQIPITLYVFFFIYKMCKNNNNNNNNNYGQYGKYVEVNNRAGLRVHSAVIVPVVN